MMVLIFEHLLFPVIVHLTDIAAHFQYLGRSLYDFLHVNLELWFLWVHRHANVLGHLKVFLFVDFLLCFCGCSICDFLSILYPVLVVDSKRLVPDLLLFLEKRIWVEKGENLSRFQKLIKCLLDLPEQTNCVRCFYQRIYFGFFHLAQICPFLKFHERFIDPLDFDARCPMLNQVLVENWLLLLWLVHFKETEGCLRSERRCPRVVRLALKPLC